MAVNARGATEPQSGLKRAVLLDKDGTLVENVPYNVDPQRIRFTPGAQEALRKWQSAGYVIVVVSNQAGIARGFVTEQEVEQAGEALGRRVAEAGATLAGFYFCPHDPEGRVERYRAVCECRKPAAGLLRRAARELQLDLARTWMIGDILDDIEAGRRAGCRTVLIDNGNETEWVPGPNRRAHHLVSRLDQAAELIIALDGANAPRERADAPREGADAPRDGADGPREGAHVPREGRGVRNERLAAAPAARAG